MQVNWLTLIIGAIALFAGFKLNQYANQQSEKRIIDALIAEIQSLKDKRLAPDEQTRLNGLREALKILKSK